MCKFFMFMTDNPFKKTHVTWSPCSGEESADDLPRTENVPVVGSGQVHDSARNFENAENWEGVLSALPHII